MNIKGRKRLNQSDSIESNDSFGSKRIMAGSPFDFNRAEPSRVAEQPSLDPERAETSRQHVHALNTQFASWVQSQLQNHPDELWEDGVQDYLTHASHIMDKFNDVVDWLKANAAKEVEAKPGIVPHSTANESTFGKKNIDFLFGTKNSESTLGTNNTDSIFGSKNSGSIFGTKNNESVFGSKNSESSSRTKNSEPMSVTKNNESIFGTNSSESVFGIKNSESISGTKNSEPISGTKNSESIFGTKNSEPIFGTKNSESLFGTKNGESVLGIKSNELKFQLPETNMLTPAGSASSFSSAWSSGAQFKIQTPTLFGSQNSTPINRDPSEDADNDDEVEKPSSPSVKKSEEKGIVVVHEVKCKLYIKSTDPADKDTWKDKGVGQLSIKCKEGITKATKDSKPTVMVRNDVGRLLLNALIYPGIKTTLTKNAIVVILHSSDEATGNDSVAARTYLIRTKSEEERDKLVTAIQEYAPSI
ncbi:hypothetical protein ACHQM5_000897 [Ranunculus cassubicifolius]